MALLFIHNSILQYRLLMKNLQRDIKNIIHEETTTEELIM